MNKFQQELQALSLNDYQSGNIVYWDQQNQYPYYYFEDAVLVASVVLVVAAVAVVVVVLIVLMVLMVSLILLVLL